MTKRIGIAVGFLICLLVLAGCSCKHNWTEADCVTAKTCSECQATEGAPLGHTPDQWQESFDPVTATVTKTQHCTVCNECTASETAPLTTMIRDEGFLFTPKEFLERLVALAEQYADELSYEPSTNTGFLAYSLYCNDTQYLLQFFRQDTTPLLPKESDVAEVWCVSLSVTGDSDKDLWHCFYMACDPALDKESALQVDVASATALFNAANNGEPAGYYQQNDLLYERILFSGEIMGLSEDLHLVNIYASDFR